MTKQKFCDFYIHVYINLNRLHLYLSKWGLPFRRIHCLWRRLPRLQQGHHRWGSYKGCRLRWELHQSRQIFVIPLRGRQKLALQSVEILAPQALVAFLTPGEKFLHGICSYMYYIYVLPICIFYLCTGKFRSLFISSFLYM